MVVRDSSSLISPNKQKYPSSPKFQLSTYYEAKNKPYSYIVLDLNQNTHEDLRVVTDNF